MAISKDIHEAFIFIKNRLDSFQYPWVLTGSLAFAYQGIPLTPHDIDIQTNEAGAYEMVERFKEYVIRDVTFSETATIRSHFGECLINGVKVEIIGDIEKCLPNGAWTEKAELDVLRTFCTYKSIKIPVLPLSYEQKAYVQMGRIEKAKLLANYI